MKYTSWKWSTFNGWTWYDLEYMNDHQNLNRRKTVYSPRMCPYMDPFIGLSSCLTVSGSGNVPFFCKITETRGGEVLDTGMELSLSKVSKMLEMIGIYEADAFTYSGFSIQRGHVPLFRSLNLRDEHIMEIVQIRGSHAYASYCAPYNDCAPPTIPRYSACCKFFKNAETIGKEQNLVYDQKNMKILYSKCSDRTL